MVELAVRNLEDVGITRKKAALITVGVAFLLGIPSAYKVSFQENQDMVWGVGLLISGMFFACAVYQKGIDRVRDIINETSYIRVGKWFNACVLAMPLIFIVIFSWWVLQAATRYPQTWWNPFRTLSPGTMAMQWAILLVFIILANNWFARKIKAPYPDSLARAGGWEAPETTERRS
jgi:NSS family neurotransmitter:Na+ symporter